MDSEVLEDERTSRRQTRYGAATAPSTVPRGSALSVPGTESDVPPAVTVMQAQPILPAQATLEQEGEQEEDDPADHQRQFAAAYAEGQRQVALKTERSSSTDRAAAKRARNAEQLRLRRANMTASQTGKRNAGGLRTGSDKAPKGLE
ncbi:unnamed protein product [Phytophthora fragariaefolia]|uniref:Unnamed protein product n=1 Tax=Phytophthora fragariaefolia TaxID=1490495 RepID=A0A9W7D7S7_9STRA|nr:unnamed protein product [Phytophthora fragariaefolia]